MSRIPDLQRQSRVAFNEMRTAEMAMDDMDIMLETPLFKKSMAAAKRWHELDDEIERAKEEELNQKRRAHGGSGEL